MKKILFASAVLLAMAACANKPVTAVEDNEESSEVAEYGARPSFRGRILYHRLMMQLFTSELRQTYKNF